MKCNNADVSCDLQREVPWLNVQVGALGSASANAIKYFLKISLKFPAAVGAARKFARIKDGCVVGKKGPKFLPLKVVECLDEVREGLAYLGLRIALGRGTS